MFKNKKIEMIMFQAVMLFLLTFLIVGCNGSDGDTIVIYNSQGADAIQIGGILALSENSPIWGLSQLQALQFAEDDVNAALADQGSSSTVSLVYGDSASQPASAEVLAASFISQGVRVMIGPVTSEELSAMEETVNQSDAIVISPSSTLPSLSVAGDNILRLVPDDNVMVQGLVQAMRDKGVASLAILYKEDSWGESLLASVTELFEAGGGTVLGSRPYYTMREDILQALLDDLSGLISTQTVVDDPSTIGFLLLGYSEGLGIMELAAADDVLGQVKWFGGDGFVNSSALLENDTVAAFAAQTEYMAPAIEFTLTEKGEALVERIESATGLPATVYSLLAYDAFYVAAQVLLNSSDSVAAASLREALASEFALYQGSTGVIELNDAGDRAGGTYYFWGVNNVDGAYQWEHVYTYDSAG